MRRIRETRGGVHLPRRDGRSRRHPRLRAPTGPSRGHQAVRAVVTHRVCVTRLAPSCSPTVSLTVAATRESRIGSSSSSRRRGRTPVRPCDACSARRAACSAGTRGESRASGWCRRPRRSSSSSSYESSSSVEMSGRSRRSPSVAVAAVEVMTLEPGRRPLRRRHRLVSRVGCPARQPSKRVPSPAPSPQGRTSSLGSGSSGTFVVVHDQPDATVPLPAPVRVPTALRDPAQRVRPNPSEQSERQDRVRAQHDVEAPHRGVQRKQLGDGRPRGSRPVPRGPCTAGPSACGGCRSSSRVGRR